MRKLYLECYTGISGDMAVAALLDLGADSTVLKNALDSLPVSGFSIQISRVKKAGLDVCDFDVILDKEHENYDHDMQYLYGEKNRSGEKHVQTHGEDKEQIHVHHKEHEHRGIGEINAIIEQAEMTKNAKNIAKKIFEILADAEAKAHGTSKEQVHFHEVGAVDSIVDVVALAVCVDNLNITETIVPVLYEGHGQVRCQHGILPVPVPAVSNIILSHKIPVHITDTQGELVTPTGAAIVAALCTTNKLPDSFCIDKIGLGAGKRAYERPSILRALLIHDDTKKIENEEEDDTKDIIYKLESNIDDVTGEALGHVMKRLLQEGARDVHYIPVFMKKNRPAYELNVICSKEDVEKMEEIIFEETTTIGIRRCKMQRTILKRKQATIHTPKGDIEYKVCSFQNKERYYPEFASIMELCEKNNASYQDMYQYAIRYGVEQTEL